MPWASPPDQKAGGVVASGKGQGKDKAKVFMVVSPTLTFREAAERLGCEVPMGTQAFRRQQYGIECRRLDRLP